MAILNTDRVSSGDTLSLNNQGCGNRHQSGDKLTIGWVIFHFVCRAINFRELWGGCQAVFAGKQFRSIASFIYNLPYIHKLQQTHPSPHFHDRQGHCRQKNITVYLCEFIFVYTSNMCVSGRESAASPLIGWGAAEAEASPKRTKISKMNENLLYNFVQGGSVQTHSSKLLGCEQISRLRIQLRYTMWSGEKWGGQVAQAPEVDRVRSQPRLVSQLHLYSYFACYWISLCL